MEHEDCIYAYDPYNFLLQNDFHFHYTLDDVVAHYTPMPMNQVF